MRRLDEDTRSAVRLFAYYVWNGTLCYMGSSMFGLFASFDYLDRLREPGLMQGLFTVYLANLGDGRSEEVDPWAPLVPARRWLKAQVKPSFWQSSPPSPGKLDAGLLAPAWKRSLIQLLGEMARDDEALWPGLGHSPMGWLENESASVLQTLMAVYLNNVELGDHGEALNHEAARQRVAKFLSSAAPGLPVQTWEMECA
jgi:hypothetical protein